jgi:hypothetical protein
MNTNRAVVIANNTFEGISVIDIGIYTFNGQRISRSPKHFIDGINALPCLRKEEIKAIISQHYNIPQNNIEFE